MSPTHRSTAASFLFVALLLAGPVVAQEDPISKLGIWVLDSDAATGGLRVSAVDPDGPGARAGVQVGDVILAINEKLVLSPQVWDQFVAGLPPGQQVRLEFWRDTEPLEVVLLSAPAMDVQELARRHCERHNQCDDLVRMLGADSSEGRRLAEKQRQFLSSKCAAEDPDACRDLGERYHRGIGVTQDRRRAAAAYAKAAPLYARRCDGGDRQACVNAANLYFDNVPGVPPDKRLLLHFAEAACLLGEGVYCQNAGVLYAGAVPELSDAGRDISRAAAYWELACSLGIGDSCYWAGRAYQRGEGVPRDTTRATELIHQACSRDDLEATVDRALTQMGCLKKACGGEPLDENCSLYRPSGR